MRGGKREGAGRKPEAGGYVRITYLATPDDHDFLQTLGEGNRSAGLRKAVEKVRHAASLKEGRKTGPC